MQSGALLQRLKTEVIPKLKAAVVVDGAAPPGTVAELVVNTASTTLDVFGGYRGNGHLGTAQLDGVDSETKLRRKQFLGRKAAFGVLECYGLDTADHDATQAATESALLEANNTATKALAEVCAAASHLASSLLAIFHALFLHMFLKSVNDRSAAELDLWLRNNVGVRSAVNAHMQGSYMVTLAAFHNKVGMCKVLLRHGANPLNSNSKGEDALAAARANTSNDAVRLLQTYHAPHGHQSSVDVSGQHTRPDVRRAAITDGVQEAIRRGDGGRHVTQQLDELRPGRVRERTHAHGQQKYGGRRGEDAINRTPLERLLDNAKVAEHGQAGDTRPQQRRPLQLLKRTTPLV